MEEQTTETPVEATLSVKVIRADGTIEEFVVPATVIDHGNSSN